MPDEEQSPPGEVTQILAAYRGGDEDAGEKLYPMVYNELMRLARRQLARERGGHTLDTAGLVNEAYLRFTAGQAVPAQDRMHFLRIASRVMRQVLVDHARKKQAAKRGGDVGRTSLDEGRVGVAPRGEELLALDAALDKLNEVDERARQIVEYRFFGGLTEQEIADILGVTRRTVERAWAKARAWLHRELNKSADGSPL